MKKAFIALVAATVLMSGAAFAEKVCSVKDGDTVKLCNGKTVRLDGIEAPNLRQPFGPDARNYLRERVLNQEVTMNCRDHGAFHDICTMQLNGADLQEEMVRQGFAFDNHRFSQGKYAQAEADARQSRRGMWLQSEGSIRSQEFGREP